MADINYEITFYSYWHCGSGTSAGADMDELVIKDKDGFPYIPGKSLKGLIREAVDNYLQFSKTDEDFDAVKVFGKEGEVTGAARFSNAQLREHEREEIKRANAQGYLYEKITTTAIGSEDIEKGDREGIAKEHSLRSMEVVVPCTMRAKITDVPNGMVEVIVRSLGLVKRMGLKRNRGLGRCDIKVQKQEGGK